MAKLPSSLLENLPNLLKSRPPRQVIEKKSDETIHLSGTQGQILPYFITDCENCKIVFDDKIKIAQITIENCEALSIQLCFVVASIEVVKSEQVDLTIPQSRGAISLDMSSKVSVRLTSEEESNKLVIYTSSCDSVMLFEKMDTKYDLPKRDILKPGRYKTWKTATKWITAKCNTYGDVEESENGA